MGNTDIKVEEKTLSRTLRLAESSGRIAAPIQEKRSPSQTRRPRKQQLPKKSLKISK